MTALQRIPSPPFMDPMTACFRHGRLFVIFSVDHHSLEEAHASLFGLRVWRHVSVSVDGWKKAKRAGPGERSTAPLPGWYDLTHLAYEHAEFGFDRTRDVLQFLPPPSTYVNVAEALHLYQPR